MLAALEVTLTWGDVLVVAAIAILALFLAGLR